MTERPNIRRMQMPERSERSKRMFDEHQDLTQEDWAKIQQKYSDNVKEENALGIAWVGSSLDVLQALQVPTVREALLKEFVRNASKDYHLAFLLNFSRSRIYYIPSSGQVEILKDRLQKQLTSASFSYGDTEIVFALISRALYSPSIEDRSWLRAQLEANRGINDYNFAAIAALLRLLGEEVTIRKKDWEAIHKSLNSFRGDTVKAANLAYLASKMKILVADKVRITDKGIECIYEPSVRENTPEMPLQSEL